jgi:hypothetical protein
MAEKEEAFLNGYLLLKIKDGSLINNVTHAYYKQAVCSASLCA